MARPDASVRVVLPDGFHRDYDAGVTVEDVAFDIGPGLGDDCVAGVVDGDLVAREHRIERDCELEVVTPGHDDRVPYMLVVGGDEAASETVSVRDRCERERDDVPLAAFRDALAAEIECRSVEPSVIETLGAD
jgi:(p)ppGpp synthase/HD superfamily hydrolase